MRPTGFLRILSIIIVAGYSIPCNAASLSDEMLLLASYYSQEELYFSSMKVDKRPIVQIAENITTITAREIENMGQHSLANILRNISGIFSNTSYENQGPALVSFQELSPRQVLVFVDGAQWNLSINGVAQLDTIPIEIVEKIEIIKGPASAFSRNALGGVISITTKGSGWSERPLAKTTVSYGERNTMDGRVSAAGLFGTMGYYLYAGRQESDGLKNDRSGTYNSLFGKLNFPINDLPVEISAGYSCPRQEMGTVQGVKYWGNLETFYNNMKMQVKLDDVTLKTVFYNYNIRLSMPSEVQDASFGDIGSSFLDEETKENNFGFNVGLTYSAGRHLLFLGGETFWGRLKTEKYSGQLLRLYGLPAIVSGNYSTQWQSLFLNDTISFTQIAIILGARYDYDPDLEGVFSPTIGITYTPIQALLFRASAGKGSSEPALGQKKIGGFFANSNSDLKETTAYSYQVGLETFLIPYMQLKGCVFIREEKDIVSAIWDENGIGVYRNAFDEKIVGYEVEFSTKQIQGFRLSCGYSSSRTTRRNKLEGHPISSAIYYEISPSIEYEQGSYYANLYGKYFTDGDASPNFRADSIICNLLLNKNWSLPKGVNLRTFLMISNLFNERQYFNPLNINPDRWVEVGVTIKY